MTKERGSSRPRRDVGSSWPGVVVGARARLRGVASEDPGPLGGDGTILRVDARGVLLRLDSGRTALCEPSTLELL